MKTINKVQVWKYLNISDGIYVVCVAIGAFLFFDNVAPLLGLWLITFLSSGLGLRRYCKGKPMMMYGTIGDEKSDDQDGIMSSYYAHRWTMVLGTLGAIVFTVYHVYQAFT